MISPKKVSLRRHRLLILFVLIGAFFFFEITIAYTTDSLVVIADAFHMLGNEATLTLAYAAVKMSPQQWKKSTFGLARVDVLAALINAVFLFGLSLIITLKSIDRFFSMTDVQRPSLLLIVGGIGLLINTIGLLLFYGCSLRQRVSRYCGNLVNSNKLIAEPCEKLGFHCTHSCRRQRRLCPGHMHVRTMFVNSLTGAMSSLLILTSGATYLLQDPEWKQMYYLDPVASMAIALVIMLSVWTLLRDSALILLQTVPKHIKIDTIAERLLDQVEGVVAVHELHIWQLTGDRIIASVHIRCRDLSEYMNVAAKVKVFFHDEGIHSTTVQPEFDETDLERCVLVCPEPNERCLANSCCDGTSSVVWDDESQSTRSRQPDGLSIRTV